MPETETSAEKGTFSSFMENVKEFFVRRDPYDIAHRHMPQSFEAGIIPLEERIAFIEANKNQIFQDINSNLKKYNHEMTPLTEEQFNAMINYYIPERIKEGDVIKVKDGELIYAELQKAVQDADNVSKNDSQLKNVPKIFLMPELPEDDSARRYILDKAYYNNTNIMYLPPIDTILINRDFISKINRENMKAFISHEAGHDIDDKTRGYAEAEYNASNHISSLFLGSDKFLDSCAKQLVSGEPTGISTECKHTLELIEDHKKKFVDPVIESKNIELSYDSEILADTYATLANPEYGKGLINFFKNNSLPNSSTHPSTLQRAEEIAQVLANPTYYKNQLEKGIEEFQKFASQPANSDHTAEKIPATTPAQSATLNNKEAIPKF